MRVSILFTILCSLCLLSAFDESDAARRAYFHISDTDVVFRIPSAFPQPVYNLKENTPTAAGFELGRRLFYDPMLSADYLTSCASCHQRFAAFAHVDHALSHGVVGAFGIRNVPALQNLAWSSNFMHDGGITHLDLQPVAPLTSPIEMNETLAHVVQKLQADTVYPQLFRKAFGDSSVSAPRLLKALSQFLVLMISSESRYDSLRRGSIAFRDDEMRGYQLFQKHCSSCHAEPLFSDHSYRSVGLPMDTALRDSGRARITLRSEDVGRFMVPSLRNIERTYPYMHDGRFRTLRQVLDFYSSGHADSTNRDPSLNNLRALSEQDKNDILVFLKTLTDQVFLRDRRFADPFQR